MQAGLEEGLGAQALGGGGDDELAEAYRKVTGAYGFVHRMIKLFFDPHAATSAEAGAAGMVADPKLNESSCHVPWDVAFGGMTQMDAERRAPDLSHCGAPATPAAHRAETESGDESGSVPAPSLAPPLDHPRPPTHARTTYAPVPHPWSLVPNPQPLTLGP